jgi:hypothetical protein
MKPVYHAGRALQIIGLIAMPSSIWASQIDRNEKLAIGIFAGSFLVFAAGYFLTRLSGRI